MTLLPGPPENDAAGATAVTVWTLEMRDASAVRPAREPAREPLLMRARRPAPELSRFFYETVGAPWFWVDRRSWSAQRWLEWVDRPEHELWTCWLDGVPAGYFELEQQVGAAGEPQVEVAYFGLLCAMTGQGLGGWLLTQALRRAWQRDAVRRVWVHTCSLDSPAALANYEARGLVRCGQQTEWRVVPLP